MTVLLTRDQYRKLFGGSRQAIHNKIKRGTLRTTIADVTEKVEMIEIDDAAFEKVVKQKEFTA